MDTNYNMIFIVLAIIGIFNIFSFIIFFGSLVGIVRFFVSPLIEPIKEQVNNYIPAQIKALENSHNELKQNQEKLEQNQEKLEKTVVALGKTVTTLEKTVATLAKTFEDFVKTLQEKQVV